MSKIVLGGVGLATLPDSKLIRLLETANELGINEIDTAPSYGMSEVNIGRCIRKSEWKINTKVGKPGGGESSAKEIVQSVDASLLKLKVEEINVLFLHSLPAGEVSDEVLDALNKLKTSGKVLKLGYSGDGLDLQNLVGGYSFDSFQASLNVLDLSNFETVRGNAGKSWYIKRPLCNQVFKLKPKLELVEFISGVQNKFSQDKNSYSFRYKELFGSRFMNQMKAGKMLTFLLSLKLNASPIVGTTSIRHLMALSEVAKNPELWEQAEVEQHFRNWGTLSDMYSWKALV